MKLITICISETDMQKRSRQKIQYFLAAPFIFGLIQLQLITFPISLMKTLKKSIIEPRTEYHGAK